jgi:transposase
MSDVSNTAGCPNCARLEQMVTALMLKQAESEARIADLEARLKRNSSNSSKPPSSDPPWQRRPPSSPTGRKPGGQPGHPGHFRTPLQPTDIVSYVPKQCECCGCALAQQVASSDPAPIRHQVMELPQQPLDVIEHQSHARTCPSCGHVTRAPIPAAVKSSVVGPRLTAALAFWVAKGHMSRRFVIEMLSAVYQVPLSLGTLAACETEMAAALETPYEAIQQAVRAALAINMDETSWRQFQQRPWVWVVASAKAVLYGIRDSRASREVKALLDNLLAPRTVGSDRFGVYNGIPLEYRQLCWAHLIRDFTRMLELKGGAEVVGQAGLDAAQAAFVQWYRFKDGFIERAELKAQMQPIRDKLEAVLREQARTSGSAQARNFAGRILRQYAALWKFVEVDGVEPTNNEAERMLRTMVQWRKNSFGCHSAGGCRFAERIMSVIQTLRKQAKSVVDYLSAAVQAHRSSTIPPPILN